jgi:dienelactone hydrolase
MKLLIASITLTLHILSAQTNLDTIYQTYGIDKNLPVFSSDATSRLNYPLSWKSNKIKDFVEWKAKARSFVIQCLLNQPPITAFRPVTIGEQERSGYFAKKIIFNITADSRVSAYLLIPKGKGPFPAVLLLHDHGARFDIGKEKVIEPFSDSLSRIKSAREWVDKNYEGRFIGDELARRGYVCFATDVLNWSDRGGAGYEGQQALASNLMNMGMSYAGLIAWEDMQSGEFLANIPEVDPHRIIAMGFSMGAFRAWQLAALSDRIAGSISVCWMATRKGLLVRDGNLTRGQSSYTTTHPNIANYLDYPDVASIACPKPMLLFNGEQDKLFPALSVREAYKKMHDVWNSQNAGKKLTTKIWETGHVFNREMQDEAFQWLDEQFKNER